ncbi:MAG: asparagine synthase C-terminal domain-containing protein [Patescibacteria group bacterium]|jgi:asparagine synthase (glutamine-hydrolysing)
MTAQQTEIYKSLLEDQFAHFSKSNLGAIGVVVSGGIDSSLIAYFVNKYFSEAYFLSVATDKSLDRPFATMLGAHFKKKIEFVEVDQDYLNSIQLDVSDLLTVSGVETNQMQKALASVYYAAFEYAHKLGIRTVFTGQGPDILFAGYSKYKKIRNSNIEIRKEILKDLPLLEIDGKRDGAMAKRWEIQLIHPYLAKEFMDFALSVPEDLLIHNGQEKYISRLVGKELGLPVEIVHRPKKAMQYSTGIQRGIQKLM